MFKVNNKDNKLWTYFTPCSSVSIVDFKQVNTGREKHTYVTFIIVLGVTMKATTFES